MSLVANPPDIQLSDLDAAREALEERVRSASVQQRLEMLDRLCRDLTRIASGSDRVS